MENNRDQNWNQAPVDGVQDNDMNTQNEQPEQVAPEAIQPQAEAPAPAEENARPAEAPAPAEEAQPAEENARPAEEAKSVEEARPAEVAKSIEEVPVSPEVARAEQAAAQARQEMESSREHVSRVGQEYLEARRELLARKRQAREAERLDKKLKSEEAARKSKEERHQELERRKQALVHTTADLSEKLRQQLSGEIKQMEKQEKTRGAEIMAVFAKHNFYAGGFTPVELRTTLEDLGPTYVKIGQIMSSRVDLLPEVYCKELEKLRQNVKELDPELARAVIEQETGKKIDEIYLEFRDKPLGSASIGQAHYGVLKDGTRVVTKVQRPLIAKMMREDFVLLKKLARIVNTVSEGEDSGQMIDLVSVIEELEKVTEEELDFRVEAENTRFFKENCIEDEEKITCPTVIDELTTERIFTMTYVDGYSISKRDRLIQEGYDPMRIGSVILDNYLHQVLEVGTFHADPHQGNIMVTYGKPVWIDFGMIGRITDSDVNIIQQLILSLVNRDMDALVNAIMSLGATSALTNRNRLMEDADVLLEKYMNVTNLAQLDLAALLDEVMNLADKHHISLPGKYTMLVRSIGTIEGVIEQLCPELNLFQQITDKLLERMRQNFDVEQELISAGKDMLETGRKVSKIPALTYDALNNAVKGRLKLNFELTGYDEILKTFNETTTNVVLALFSCVLLIASALLSSADIQPKTPSGQPLIAAAGMVFAIALGIYTVKRMTKKKR